MRMNINCYTQKLRSVGRPPYQSLSVRFRYTHAIEFDNLVLNAQKKDKKKLNQIQSYIL